MSRKPVFKVGIYAYVDSPDKIGDLRTVIGIEGVREYKAMYSELPANRIYIKRIAYTTNRGGIITNPK